MVVCEMAAILSPPHCVNGPLAGLAAGLNPVIYMQLVAWHCYHLIKPGPPDILETARPSNKTINSVRPEQNGRHLADNVFKWIFLNEN